jgi:hypothetical protein
MWDLWGRFSSSTSVSTANLHSTNFSTITFTYHPGWYNRPVVAAVPEVPPHKQKKKSKAEIVVCIYVVTFRGRQLKMPWRIFRCGFVDQAIPSASGQNELSKQGELYVS